MPIRSMFFEGDTGRDIHLIRGDAQHKTSRSIRDFGLAFMMVVAAAEDKPIFASDYFKRHTDVVLTFRPTFRHDDNGTSANLENFGINVSRLTGRVEVAAGPIPKPFPSNFLLEITAAHRNVTPAPAPVTPLAIRVHVHEGVDRIWITPEKLTVRRRTASGAEDTSYRFTVRARFTDGAVGDITLFHGVTWAPAPKHFKSGPFATLEAAQTAGFIQLPANFMGSAVPVTATWQAGGQTHAPTAEFSVAKPWASETSVPPVELVEGTTSVWAGNSPAKSPNVLLMGVGFKDGPTAAPETEVFKQIAAKVALDFRTDRMLRPYDLLARSMNIWRVAFPAANAGVSVRGAVYLPRVGVEEYASLLPPPRKHPGGAARWNVGNVIYALGLPLPSYLKELKPPGDVDAAAFKAFWSATAQEAVPGIGNNGLDSKTIAKWFELANVRFIDEVDSFPALAVGSPPNADLTDRGDSLNLHPERGNPLPREGVTTVPELRAFLASLKSSNGHLVPGGALGHLWSEDRADFGFDNRKYVVFVIAAQGGAIQDPEFGVYVPIEKAELFHIAPVEAGQVKHDRIHPIAAPTPSTFPEFSRLVAHELSHAFGLRDEYAEFPQSFTDAEATLNNHPNVTSLAAVTNGGRVQSGLIKWNWDRIQRAAILTGSVTGGGGAFNIPVVGGHQLAFAPGDRVRLRRRVPRRQLGRAIDTPTTFSDFELTVVSDGTIPIRVTSATAKLTDLAPFQAGSIVYVPIRAVPANAASPFLKLIAPITAAQIDASGDALTGPAAACNPVREASKGVASADQVPLLDQSAFPLFFSFRNTHRVVGLYSGGMRFGCGVFHPAGACMMRSHFRDATQFCHVCRYALVDFIDPTKHGEIDEDYAKIYPD